MAEKVRMSEDTADDSELDKLLSDALDDFGKTLPEPHEPKSPPQDDEVVDGLANEMESCLKEATQLLSEQNPELMKEFEKLFSQSAAAAAASEPQPHQPSSQSGSSSIEETLEQTFQQMKQNTSNQFDMDKLSAMFGGVDLSSGGVAGGDSDEELMGMMQSMMESLLSRDVLYPSLQAICKKYPEWIESHKDQLSSHDFSRYRNQLDIMRRICDQFEGPHPSTDEEKLANQQKILDLMQQLQQYGQPPPELADTMGPFNMDGGGLPNTPPDNCTLM